MGLLKFQAIKNLLFKTWKRPRNDAYILDEDYKVIEVLFDAAKGEETT